VNSAQTLVETLMAISFVFLSGLNALLS
jgi:hypothetical protein